VANNSHKVQGAYGYMNITVIMRQKPGEKVKHNEFQILYKTYSLSASVSRSTDLLLFKIIMFRAVRQVTIYVYVCMYVCIYIYINCAIITVQLSVHIWWLSTLSYFILFLWRTSTKIYSKFVLHCHHYCICWPTEESYYKTQVLHSWYVITLY
jgi:hypothetical protein